MRKALYILGILDDSDASWLATTGKARSISAGTVIIQQGVPVDSVFILIDGQLQVYSGNVEIARLLAGEIVGEISFVDSRPPSASVKATVDSQVLGRPQSRAPRQAPEGPGICFAVLPLTGDLSGRPPSVGRRPPERPARKVGKG